MENAFLEYDIGQTEAEENSSFSSALLVLTVTALNIPKEACSRCVSVLSCTSAKYSDRESGGSDKYMYGNETEHA